MTIVRKPEHTHMVSYWYIPGGCDYHNAEIVERFFESEKAAQLFADTMNHPPECPVVIDLVRYDKL